MSCACHVIPLQRQGQIDSGRRIKRDRPKGNARERDSGIKEDGTQELMDLDSFNCKDVRKTAANFGCERCSAQSKFECRRRMAVRVTAGDK